MPGANQPMKVDLRRPSIILGFRTNDLYAIVFSCRWAVFPGAASDHVYNGRNLGVIRVARELMHGISVALSFSDWFLVWRARAVYWWEGEQLFSQSK